MTRSLALVAVLAALLVAGCGGSAPPSPTAGPATGAAATALVPTMTPATSGASSVPAATTGSTSEPSTEAPTMTPSPPTSSPAPTPSPAPQFSLTSTAFRADEAIPRVYTCDGADVSPDLAWTGMPEGAGWLVLLVDDPDARDFAHWIAFALPASTTNLARGAGAAGSGLVQGINDFGRVGYGGPCPPAGTHHYRFTLYALKAPLGLSGHPRATTVRAALARADILGKATLTATYRRS